MRIKRVLPVLILVVVAMLMVGFTGFGRFGVNEGLPAPDLGIPSVIVRDRTPEFSWTVVLSATEYEVQVRTETTTVSTEPVSTSNCGISTCTYEILTVLDYQDYSLWGRAKVFGVWTPYSQLSNFRIVKPVLKHPTGTIVDPTPRYVWVKEIDATSYQIQLVKGTSVIYSKVISSPTCGAANCLYTPPDVIGLGIYKWRLRVLADGVWGSWTNAQTFILKEDPSFFSDFNTHMDGWSATGGTWEIAAGKVLKTRGEATMTAFVYYTDANFENLRYQVKMVRAGTNCPACTTGIYIRGQVTPFSDSQYSWNKGYLFAYNNNGEIGVFKADSGWTTLQTWAYSPAVNPYGWNILRVDAIGSTLKFYVNNALVYSGTDTTHTIGKVGITMVQPGFAQDVLYVDWASASYRNPTTFLPIMDGGALEAEAILLDGGSPFLGSE